MSDLGRAWLATLDADDLRTLADQLAPLLPSQPAIPAVLSVNAVASHLGCSSRTVRRRITEGSLPAVLDHGRVVIRADELKAYVADLEGVGSPTRPSRTSRRAAAGRYDFLRT
jgi:excisionase family DNA binding protein